MSSTDVAFSTRLREATWSDHRVAESPPFLSALVGGDLDRAGYARLVAQHYFIYRALEACAGPMRDDPVAGGFVDDRLTRLPALVADLEFLVGPDWDGRITAAAATREYVDRIRAVCDTGPARFLAHHYTRYLGDLSGGLFIGRGVARAYGLTDGRGVAFYRFEAIGDPRAYKDAYRRRLDALELPEPDRAALIEEVVVAYRHNTAVLTELGGNGPFTPEVVAAIGRHMNDDHAADSLLICRSLGGRPAATAARMTGLDADGIDFTVTEGDGEVGVRIPFGHRLTERAEVRREVVRMYRQACAQFGLPARQSG